MTQHEQLDITFIESAGQFIPVVNGKTLEALASNILMPGLPEKLQKQIWIDLINKMYNNNK